MSFFFRPRSRTPSELVRGTRDAIQNRLDHSDKRTAEKANEEISRNLLQMKQMLYGDGENDPVPEVVAHLAHEFHTSDLLLLLTGHLHRFEFEAKKDVAQIFNNLLRRQVGARLPTVEYLCEKESVLVVLVHGYENPDMALNCGMILRDCIRHEPLARRVLLNRNCFYKFFDYVERGTFDVASDAFATFKDLLTKHKSLVAEFLENSYDEFFESYAALISSSNYVTKRQSLKLLGELLLDRSNFNVMTKYIASTENLKVMMNLLRDRSRNIQFEAFHVFKVFVANPNKTRSILDILRRNKDRLLPFMIDFHNDRTDDEQFNTEKAFLIRHIQDL